MAAAHGVPLVGNGDVLTLYEARRRLDTSGCHAAMVGRWGGAGWGVGCRHGKGQTRACGGRRCCPTPAQPSLCEALHASAERYAVTVLAPQGRADQAVAFSGAEGGSGAVAHRCRAGGHLPPAGSLPKGTSIEGLWFGRRRGACELRRSACKRCARGKRRQVASLVLQTKCHRCRAAPSLQEHFRDDERGRRASFYFLPWHFNFFSRYR